MGLGRHCSAPPELFQIDRLVIAHGAHLPYDPVRADLTLFAAFTTREPRYRVRCPAPHWPAFRVILSWPVPRPRPGLTRLATVPSACATTWPAARPGLCLAAGFPLFPPVARYPR